jgi:hypothetical protein
MRLLLASLPFIAAACVIDLPDIGGVRSSRVDTLSFIPSASVTEVFVDTFNGGVTIAPGIGAGVSGSSKVWASGSTDEKANARLAEMKWTFVEETGGRLVVRMSEPDGGSNNAGASATLQVPAGVRVLVDTSNGAVEVQGEFPYAWVDTSNAAVVVKGARDVFVDTSNGPVEVNADGKVVIDTSNGPVVYIGASNDFFIDSSNANIKVGLAGDWNGKGVVDTSNGSIGLDCSGVLNCALEHDTSNGRLKMEGPEIAGKDGSLNLQTSNGSISVKHGKP